jgi:uncharacterized protein YjbI with pentapeptide repeats
LANLQEAKLEGANLQGADLYGANLQESNLQCVDFYCERYQRQFKYNPINNTLEFTGKFLTCSWTRSKLKYR